ncbi:MAG: AAA family ATPase, partial [Deltaproteobacteria bacterium]|nr:AAA family ATPase [Deltaproteobacteria bacterium]
MGTPQKVERAIGTATDFFDNSLQHLLAELERIDLLIASQVARARRLHADDEQFRGLYISEDEIDALLRQPLGRPRWASGPPAPGELAAALDKFRRHNSSRKQESLKRGIELRLQDLQHVFGLDAFEVDALIVCLAVEVDLRYEKLYAYLNDDVTKKRPSIELVLNLLTQSTEAAFAARNYFTSRSRLLRNHLLEPFEDPSQPHSPLLAQYLKVDPRVAQYLLNSDAMDERINLCASLGEPTNDSDGLLVDEAIKRDVVRFVGKRLTAGGVIIHLSGPYGVGKQNTAQAVSKELGMRLLMADLGRIMCDGDASCAKIFELIQREAKLQHAAIYWRGFDTLLSEDKKAVLAGFLSSLPDRPAVTFLAGEGSWEPNEALRTAQFARLELRKPSSSERLRIWSTALNGGVHPDVDIAALASKFKFTGGQIQDAAATAENLARLRDAEALRITTQDLYEACRLHSNQKLTTLARKISPKYRWDDIVLPADRVEQLREICNHVKYRERVYGEWGFDKKLSLGKGLSVLFSGPSGTGKTMAAEIIAGALGLELFKIDLSTVVSKYIGETEKNLSRIFIEAETSNAILFFDEADALFGKRSEVKDSHDRYANIEIGYLLQRMEEYEGVVILATNFRKNMDEAFVRRLHFTVEFPFPNEADRLKIWQGIWPEDTPRDEA